MSIENLTTRLHLLEYQPHALRLFLEKAGDLLHAMSPAAQAFYYRTTEDRYGGYVTWSDFYGKRWSDHPEILKKYYDLDNNERAEILGFYTFLLHEATHHIDFMITPFGVNFHLKACLEYIAFQDFAPKLLEFPNLIPNGRLVDFGDQITSLNNIDLDLVNYWKNLEGKIALFDALKRSRKDKIQSGWGKLESIVLMKRKLNTVTVQKFMFTVTVPDHPGWYLRPTTILEARALIHSLRWILYLFGHQSNLSQKHDNPIEKDNLILFINTFYSPQSVAPDYTFLFQLLSSLYSFNNLVDLIKAMPVPNLDSNLMLLDSLCWYALQAPPPREDIELGNASPIARLIIAIMELETMLEDKSKKGEKLVHRSSVDFLNEMDSACSKYHLLPVEENLKNTYQLIEFMKIFNKKENCNSAIQTHFDYIFETQTSQLRKRLPFGYNSELGMPENGNPVFGVVDEQDAAQLLMEYSPSHEVLSWFRFRENLLFKFLPAQVVKEELEKRFPRYNMKTCK